LNWCIFQLKRSLAWHGFCQRYQMGVSRKKCAPCCIFDRSPGNLITNTSPFNSCFIRYLGYRIWWKWMNLCIREKIESSVAWMFGREKTFANIWHKYKYRRSISPVFPTLSREKSNEVRLTVLIHSWPFRMNWYGPFCDMSLSTSAWLGRKRARGTTCLVRKQITWIPCRDRSVYRRGRHCTTRWVGPVMEDTKTGLGTQ